MSDTVKAAWNGPYVGEIGSEPIYPGDVLEIPADQANSGHWTVVDSNGAPAPTPTPPAEPTPPVVLSPEKDSLKEGSK